MRVTRAGFEGNPLPWGGPPYHYYWALSLENDAHAIADERLRNMAYELAEPFYGRRPELRPETTEDWRGWYVAAQDARARLGHLEQRRAALDTRRWRF